MSTQKNKIDWLNHSLEFAVVIIGILIAFQLNQWSVEKEQEKIIAIHLDQIKKESEINEHMLASAIEQGESNLNRLDTIIGLILQKGNPQKINILALELLNLGGVYIRKNDYRTLI